MGGGERTYRPRARTTRLLDEPRSSNSPPAQPIPAPIERDGFWFLPDPVAQRLHQKSALGLRVSDGILLTAEEVMFCHWYRHVPLPNEHWLEEELQKNPRLIYEAIIMDSGRNGGEMIVPSIHRPQIKHHLAWGVRWHRDRNHLKEMPQASISIAATHDELDWDELLDWCVKAKQMNVDAELFVIDEELDVTMYKLMLIEPKGDRMTWDDLNQNQKGEFMESWSNRTNTDHGSYVRHEQPWVWNQIGIEHMSGRVLRQERSQLDRKMCAECQ